MQNEKIYMTTGCALRLKAELKDLLYKQRPEMVNTVAWAASNGDRSENADYHYGKKKLRQIDGRIRFLQQRLEQATVVDPLQQQGIADGRTLFGGTVTVETDSGEEKTYCIVGVDEIDLSKGRISWVSPIGKALLGASAGDLVSYRSPRGEEELEVVRVEYLRLD
ncbi:MAG: transcription elongation factor GreB [Deltaproteobacteria bacterium]|nr:transcription elongation factor GreB [Deltaproteobacteria bacterium]